MPVLLVGPHMTGTERGVVGGGLWPVVGTVQEALDALAVQTLGV